MKNETLDQVINQIRKYELTELFPNIDAFKNWVSKLNNTQVNNFLSLNIDVEEVSNIRDLLINKDLLCCKDYINKVEAIAKLKNGDGCWHLYKYLCNPNFLNSKTFYSDLETLSKSDTSRYGLWILGKKDFINSPYHDEDLKLLVETHDSREGKELDFLVSGAIATVAGNIDSIKSPYHQLDMKLIATAGSDCLQMNNSYPERSLNNLAVNKISLEDKYHLENMQILSKNPVGREYLYIIMTEPSFVNGKNYRKEIEALVNAKSKTTARALCYYMISPKKMYLLNNFCVSRAYEYEIDDIYDCSVSGDNDPDYLDNLTRINKMDDKFIIDIVSIMKNTNFINSSYKNFDLDLLQSVSSEEVFRDLGKVMTNENSLKSKYHQEDVVLVSCASDNIIRDLLVRKACNKDSLNSVNHMYDMEFIFKLDLDNISTEIYDEMCYYWFEQEGIDDLKHSEKLERLLQGELVERCNSLSNYLDNLQNQIYNNRLLNDELTPTASSKQKSKILSLFLKKRRK